MNDFEQTLFPECVDTIIIDIVFFVRHDNVSGRGNGSIYTL